MNRENDVWIGFWATTKIEMQNQLTKSALSKSCSDEIRKLCRKTCVMESLFSKIAGAQFPTSLNKRFHNISLSVNY